jgi:hypothetical protein
VPVAYLVLEQTLARVVRPRVTSEPAPVGGHRTMPAAR